MKKLVFVLVSILFICGCSVNVKPVEDVTDDEIISLEYSLPDDHPFIHLDSSELEEFLKNGSGILVISNPENEFSQYLIKLFNTSLKDLDVDEVYYFDYVDLKDLSSDINKILNIDEKYLKNKPEFYLIKNGKILNKYNLDSFDIDDMEMFSNEEFDKNINDFYTNLICELYENKCNDKKN